jgi:hypothetical protein
LTVNAAPFTSTTGSNASTATTGLPPDAARHVRQLVGIDEEYDLTIPPDPDDDAMVAARQKLTELIR